MALTLPKIVAYIRAEIENAGISDCSHLEVLLEPLLQRVGDLVELIELPDLVSDGLLYLHVSMFFSHFHINRIFSVLLYSTIMRDSVVRKISYMFLQRADNKVHLRYESLSSAHFKIKKKPHLWVDES